jgi:hypothetical protein
MIGSLVRLWAMTIVRFRGQLSLPFADRQSCRTTSHSGSSRTQRVSCTITERVLRRTQRSSRKRTNLQNSSWRGPIPPLSFLTLTRRSSLDAEVSCHQLRMDYRCELAKRGTEVVRARDRDRCRNGDSSESYARTVPRDRGDRLVGVRSTIDLYAAIAAEP